MKEGFLETIKTAKAERRTEFANELTRLGKIHLGITNADLNPVSNVVSSSMVDYVPSSKKKLKKKDVVVDNGSDDKLVKDFAKPLEDENKRDSLLDEDYIVPATATIEDTQDDVSEELNGDISPAQEQVTPENILKDYPTLDTLFALAKELDIKVSNKIKKPETLAKKIAAEMNK